MGTTIISFIIVLGVLIFIHEFGHFIVAKLCGVGVEKFSIGFGPKLFGWKRGMTDYMVSVIPLGGYVKMVGEEPDAPLDEEDIPYSFTHKNVWQRFAIVAAGPIFNFILAVVLYYFLYLIHGTYFYPAVIGEVKTNSPAYYSGLEIRDIVKSVNGQDIDSWSEFESLIEKSEGREIVLEIDRNKDIKEIVVKPEKMDSVSLFGEKIKRYSIGADIYLPPVVGSVGKDSPAYDAGVKEGDLILSIAGETIDTWNDVSRVISSSEGPLEFVFARNDDVVKYNITPTPSEYQDHLGNTVKRNMIGIGAKDVTMHKNTGFIGSMERSLTQTYRVIELTFVGIVKMIDGTISRDNLGGPIMIAQMAGDQAKLGITNLIAFIALISINLGLLNLLPVPVLDGGHLMFFLIEGITRKPVSLKIRQTAQQIGLFLLLMLMGYAVYNDILRVFSK